MLNTAKKILSAGKGGEAAIKLDACGSFVTPSDTISDNIKLMEEILNQSNLKDQVKVGIKFIGDTMYSSEK